MPDNETLQIIFAAIGGGIVALISVYGGMRLGVKQLGAAIPGEDFFERLDAKLTAKVDPIVDAVERGVDKLNPLTHGGAGQGPDVKPPANG